MNSNSFLTQLLEGAGEYALTDNDLTIISREGIVEYIKSKLYSKKFRKWKLDEECKNIVDNEVTRAVEEGRSINIFFAQGCYKLWRVASAPKANWAEFFNISYLTSYVAPIAAVYSPGVNLTYHFLTVLPQTHNNLSEHDVRAYYESFSAILSEYKKYLPENIRVNIATDLDLHNRSEYDDLLSKAMSMAEEKYSAWPQAKQDDYVRRAWLNIKWDGVQDWTDLGEKEKTRLVKRAVLYEYAATQDILMNDKKGRGVILSTLPKEDSIGIGSTATSVAKHWVGEGVLEMDKESFYPRILSPSQYEFAHKSVHETQQTTILSSLGFNSIEIFPRHFDFS